MPFQRPSRCRVGASSSRVIQHRAEVVGCVCVGSFDEVGVYAEGRPRVRVTEASVPTLRVVPNPRVGKYGRVESIGWNVTDC